MSTPAKKIKLNDGNTQAPLPSPSTPPADIDFLGLIEAAHANKRKPKHLVYEILRHVFLESTPTSSSAAASGPTSHAVEGQYLWAWSISEENSYEIRRLIDLGKRLYMAWRQAHGLPRIINADGRLELKHPAFKPGWISCKGLVRDVEGTFVAFQRMINMGFFPENMTFEVRTVIHERSTAVDVLQAVLHRRGLEDFVDLTNNGPIDRT